MQRTIFEQLPFPASRFHATAFDRTGLGRDSGARFGFDLEAGFGLEQEVDRASRAYGVWVQSSLNRILGTRLVTDGIVGVQTRSAIRSFQGRKGLAADGIVGPLTEAALVAAGADRPPDSGTSAPPSGGLVDSRISVELPLSGPGFYSYDRELDADGSGRPHQYGRVETIRAVRAIASAWQRRHPGGPRVGIGHLSLRGGGPTPGHSQHRTGLEIDVRPVRRDGVEGPTTWQSSSYSRELTQELVDLMRVNGVLPIHRILFNDRSVRGTQTASGHDNHLHLWFSEPAASANPRYR